MYLKERNVFVNGSLEQIYITDDLTTARGLKGEGEAVLVYLHQGNDEEDFSEFFFAVEEPEALEDEYLERVYLRLKGLPWNILETERCLIRESTVEDVEAFYRIYSDPSITEYMEDLFPEIEQEKQYIRDYIERVYGFYEFGIWTVVEKEGGRVIGRAGLSYRVGFEEPELGFVIGVPWQRKGYALEVCRAILQYGTKQLGFSKIHAFVEPGNKASLNLCAKLGMESLGRRMVDGEEYVRFLYEADAVFSQ